MQEETVTPMVKEITENDRVYVYDSKKITYEQAQRVQAIIAHAAELMEKPPASISAFEACGLDTWKTRALSHIFVEKIGDVLMEYSPEKARNTHQFLRRYTGNFDVLTEVLDHFLERAGASTLASLMLRRDTLLLLQKYSQMAVQMQENNISNSNEPPSDDTSLLALTN